MRRPTSNRGFTLVEALISSALAVMLMIAMLDSYVFLARRLVKAAYFQDMEYRSRIALGLFTRDLQSASAVTSPTGSSLTLTVPSGSVTYTYDAIYETLSRSANFGAFRDREFFRGSCTAFTFNYYTTTGTTALGGTIVPLSVKRVSASFTLQRGADPTIDFLSRTYIELKAVSPRVLLRNKALPDGT